MQLDSYEGTDRGFILRFLNAGTTDRETRFGNRGSLTARHWFGISSAFQVDAAASRVAEEIENLLQQEFQQM
jgi:tRNA(Met) C34 N-acetyltransferase TmcA